MLILRLMVRLSSHTRVRERADRLELFADSHNLPSPCAVAGRMHEWWTIFVVVIAVGIGSCALIGLCCFLIRFLMAEPMSRAPSSIIYTKRKQPTDFRKKSPAASHRSGNGHKEQVLDPEEEQAIVRELALV